MFGFFGTIRLRDNIVDTRYFELMLVMKQFSDWPYPCISVKVVNWCSICLRHGHFCGFCCVQQDYQKYEIDLFVQWLCVYHEVLKSNKQPYQQTCIQ